MCRVWQDLPLVTRAREVLRYALRRVGRDSFAAIARDVVNASGWFVRLAQRGPEGKAIAANVLKALDAVAEAEAEFGNSPRSIALAFDRFLAGKEAPGCPQRGGRRRGAHHDGACLQGSGISGRGGRRVLWRA